MTGTKSKKSLRKPSRTRVYSEKAIKTRLFYILDNDLYSIYNGCFPVTIYELVHGLKLHSSLESWWKSFSNHIPINTVPEVI